MSESPMINGQIQNTLKQNLYSKLALGTVQFGIDYGISNNNGKTPFDEVEKILSVAKELGISMLDTAQAYGDSEEIIGSLDENRFQVVTKLHPSKLSHKEVKDLISDSLDKLRCKSLYAVLFHNAQSAFEHTEAIEALKSEKMEERIKKYGYSVYTPQELEQLIALYGMPDLVQVPFSHLDRRFEVQLKALKGQGVEIHTRSTFLQGLFFVNPNSLNDFFTPVKEYIGYLQQCFNSKSMLAAYLLKFVLDQPFIDHVVIGVNTAKQLMENLTALIEVEDSIEVEIPLVHSKILMPNLWPQN